MSEKKKIIRVTTVPISLEKLLSGQIGFMKEHFEIKAVSSEPERLAAFGKAQKIETHAVGLTRKLTPIQDLKALWQLYRYLKTEKPFIVHSHTPKAGTVGMMAAKLAGVPHRLHTVAGLPLLVAKGKKRKLLDFVEKITYSAATKVYPNSYGLRDIIIQNGYCKPEKLKVLGNGSSNGIDTSFFDPSLFSEKEVSDLRQSLGIASDDVVFIFIGRLVKDKGIRELISAFDRIGSENPKAKLLLVGRYEPDLDPLDEQTKSKIASNKNIIETGYQTEVRPYFLASDILTFPSYREGFPNVVLQAAAMRLPAIVSDINGCNEIITQGKNGLIVPVEDENALHDAMLKLLNDNVLRQKMRDNSRQEIKERYEQSFVWNAILEEYRALKP
ncbi:glycosyltransferase family 4 protein [Flavobacterium sp. MAH-1]|uniref:Glycosyltransferase family 4 protein n=1 Tax=Flavobacterium agri TaxID=2743471 RepID=A0A7Y8Y2V0_9FLAO|nr:glycosyltransferase family 4 protein [Flavobacterium agri]NUY80879.1 glycosyltransferase family 4 protein [Flavobacterium agri]NYA70903.1 glycosyltransferase family 4 protein [Flavobacterium agri]